MRNKKWAGIAVGMLVAAGGVVAIGSPAVAASCVRTDYKSFASDYARTTDASGTCGTVYVGHYFNPSGTTSTIYTGTFSDPNAVQTGRAAQLSSSYHANA